MVIAYDTGNDSDTHEPLLRVRDLCVEFPLDGGEVRHAVNDVSFDVPQGSVTCLVGESGSGKSVTAMSTIDLVDEPGRIASGTITFDGRDVLSLNHKNLERLRGEGISMIFQEPMHSLNPVLRVGKQLSETIQVHSGASRESAWKRSVQWLKRVGLPNPERVMNMYPHELSGGMAQRVMIAIALCCGPKLLIADEPTTALDVTIQAQIIHLLLKLKEEIGLSILFITHDFGVVAEVADYVVVMYEGKVVEHGDVYGIFDHPQHPYTKALLETRPMIGARRHRLPTVRDLVPQFSALSGGNSLAVLDDASAPEDGEWNHGCNDSRESPIALAKPDEPLVEVKHLKKYFVSQEGFFSRTTHTVRGVNDVSFEIFPGEAVGLVGESGSGKTTLGQTILRLQNKTSGEVRFRGRNIFDLDRDSLRDLRPQMQYIFQDPYSSLNPRLPIITAIGEPMLEHGLADKTTVRDRVTDVLRLCGMDADALDRYPHEFSGGQRQRIGIARAMGLKPDFVVADEPVASLDVSVQAQIINLFSDLQERRGTTFMFISHDLSVVEHLCSRLMIMYLGVIVEVERRFSPIRSTLIRRSFWMRFLRRIRRGGMLCGSRIPNPLRFEDRMRMTFVTGRCRSYARSMSIIGRLGADTCRIMHCVFPLLEWIGFTTSGRRCRS